MDGAEVNIITTDFSYMVTTDSYNSEDDINQLA